VETSDSVAKDREIPLWGATVCAHAVEGADFHADWWRWEQGAGHIQGGDTSERAAAHFERHGDDLALAAKLGLNVLQYSLSWARVMPEPGEIDDDAVRHYTTVFKNLVTRGLRPIAVLQEHSLPAWFSQRGAWEHPDATADFAAYVDAVYGAIGGYCEDWIPHMEPLLWLSMAYGERCWPPPTGHGRPSRGMDGLAKAHLAAFRILKSASPKNQVAVSLYVPHVYPLDPYSPWDARAAEHRRRWFTHRYVKTLRAAADGASPFDFVALSCPGKLGIHAAPWRIRNGFAQYERVPGEPCAPDQTEPDWASTEELIRSVGDWGVPLLLTGAGIATEDDGERCHHLLDQIDGLLRLRKEGLSIRGYCYRSFLDGFVWHHGYGQRYGLVHIDRDTLTRTPNPSAFLYQDIIREQKIRPGAVTRFAPDWQSPHVEHH